MTMLTPYERETIVITNDADDFALVSSSQRAKITKLRKIVAACREQGIDAEETTSEQEKKFGGASFRIPANLVGFRVPRRERATTRKQADPKEMQIRMAKARAARGK